MSTYWISWFKHWILEWIHGQPKSIDVFCGAPGTMEHAITRCVTRWCGGIPNLQEVNITFTDDTSHAQVWINDEREGLGGYLTVCRYLGRLWHIYPTNPSSAVLVDGLLDTLDRFVRDIVRVHTAQQGAGVSTESEAISRILKTYVTHSLEPRMGEWLEDMDAPSLADVCWAGALKWLAFRYDVTVHALEEECPATVAWWAHMQNPATVAWWAHMQIESEPCEPEKTS